MRIVFLLICSLCLSSWAVSARTATSIVTDTDKVVDKGAWPKDPKSRARIEHSILPWDYPPRSLREKQEGVVESWVIFGPNGRPNQVGIISAPSRLLAETFEGLMLRRLRNPFDPSRGRFVKVRLPPFQFRLHPCMTERPITPAVKNAIVVDAECSRTLFQKPNVEIWGVHDASS